MSIKYYDDKTVEERAAAGYDPKSSYYAAGGIESHDVVKAKLTPEQYEGWHLGVVLSYLMRWNFKHEGDTGEQLRDLEKCVVHLNWMLASVRERHEVEVDHVRRALDSFEPTSTKEEQETLAQRMANDHIRQFIDDLNPTIGPGVVLDNSKPEASDEGPNWYSVGRSHYCFHCKQKLEANSMLPLEKSLADHLKTCGVYRGLSEREAAE